mmetsp:Transcript_32831/g.57365  ORF Transcript_32831/g.57365 Transcript_32831/m.57365 type:complete len:305 (-) Transcript_32831:1146-2060(-)
MAELVTLNPEGLQGLVTRSKYLLKQFGFPEFGEFTGCQPEQMSQTLSCIDALLASRQRELSQRSELFERIQASEREKLNLMNDVDRAQQEVERLQSELSKLDMTYKSNQQRWNEERKQLTEERSRLLIDLKKFQSRDVQTQHELKQLNMQIVKLENSLRKTLGEKDLVVKNPLELTSTLQGALGQIASLGGFEEFSRVVVSGYNELRGAKDEIQRLDYERNELMKGAVACLGARKIRANTPEAASRQLIKLAEELAATQAVDIEELQKNLLRWKGLAEQQMRLLIALEPERETEVLEDEGKTSK